MRQINDSREGGSWPKKDKKKRETKNKMDSRSKWGREQEGERGQNSWGARTKGQGRE